MRAAAVAPCAETVPSLACFEHHDFVVALKGNKPATTLQLNEPIEHALGIGPAINVIAERDDKIIRLRFDEVQERIKRREAAVDVTDGEGAHCRSRLTSFHNHSNRVAAAQAQGREAAAKVAPLQGVQQRDEDARAGSADRMPQSDRAAVNVELRLVDPQILVARQHLSRESFVQLEKVNVADGQLSFFQYRTHGADRS